MKGINTRLVQAFLVVIVLVIGTNFRYIFFGEKKEANPPVMGPATGPAPETPEEEEEEEEVSLLPADVLTTAIAEAETEEDPSNPADVLTTAIVEAQENAVVVADVKAIETLPIGVVKKEAYVAYSEI
jgi:hypothetical protein